MSEYYEDMILKNTKKTVNVEQIQKVVGNISKKTLEIYLNNWRFVPFERKVKIKNYYRREYLCCKDFFNNLYTFLMMKRFYKEAKNLSIALEQNGINLEFLEE